MNINEKIEMYKGKKVFINYLSKAFEMRPSGLSVEKVDYEVWVKEVNPDTTYVAEYLIVTFDGGGKSVRNVIGNSNLSNLAELSKLVNGGYYDEVKAYMSLSDRGFEYLALEV